MTLELERDVSPFCFWLMRRVEHRFRPWLTMLRLLLDEASASGWQCKACPSWKRSMESPEPRSSETTWKARSTTVQPTWQPPNTWRSAWARSQRFAQSTTSDPGGTERSQSRSEQAISLLTAQQIMQFDDEQVIAFHRRLPPIQAQRIDWRGNDLLEARRRMSPPILACLQDVSDHQEQPV